MSKSLYDKLNKGALLNAAEEAGLDLSLAEILGYRV
jgi:hypothetical protein